MFNNVKSGEVGLEKGVAVYLRVSSKSQRVDSQRAEIERYLAGHGVVEARWFVDHYTARPGAIDRPALNELRAAAFAGEVRTIVLFRLDRLARSIRDGINLLTDWLNAGVRVVVVTMQIDLSGALGQTVAALLLGLAQMEREAIRERQAAGIAAAKARGERWGGRKPGTFKADPARVAELLGTGLAPEEVAQALGISARTVYRMRDFAEGQQIRTA